MRCRKTQIGVRCVGTHCWPQVPHLDRPVFSGRIRQPGRHTLASHRRWVTDGLPILRASLQPSLRDTFTAPNLLIYSILKRELVDSSSLLPKNSRLSVVK